MNLTLIFIVLSLAIGYMLYDTFKKSKQSHTHQQKSSASKIKTNYADQCRILKNLHQEKINALKHRSISIHLDQQTGMQQSTITSKYKQTLQNVMTCLNKNSKIYVLINKGLTETHLQKALRKYLPEQNFIPYNTIEGAVAILRQLNCNVHLESDQKLLKVIKQYIPNIWFAGKDLEQSAKYCFNNEFQMINTLQKLIEAYDLRKSKKND